MSSREEFEAWVTQRGFTSEQANGFYDEPRVHDWWSAWQAASEALLKKQAQEQEEFLAHLADFEQEDTFHG